MSVKLKLNKVDDIMDTYICESLVRTTCQILLFYQYLVKILSEFTKKFKIISKLMFKNA